MTDKQYYEINICGLNRKLVKCPVNENLDIAAFVMLGDVELTVEAAKNLLLKVPAHDIIISAEAKGIPIAYEMARQSGKHYIIARKSTKLYMQDPIKVQVKSITTEKAQELYIDVNEAEQIRGRRILIVDDVISTGESLKALEALIEKAGGIIVGKAAVLAEGDAIGREDITYLEPLPLFFK